MKRALFFTVGWLSVALAIAGALLPLIPCTPFVLLAAVCFARSSPRAMHRLRRSPLLGPVLRDWQQYHGMRPAAKVSAVCVAIGAPAITFAIQQQVTVPLLISIAGGMAAIGIVCWLPTVWELRKQYTTSSENQAADKVRRAA
jgi:uncharacterized membrane protein YbaN (DUF454 family)